jgi:PHD/YefM family antitoxin component YafN of YafNO toxin-antitoxin module
MKTLILKEAQALYNALDESQVAQEPLLIERDGRPIGVLVPIAEYEAFRAWREAEERRHKQSDYDEAFQREVEAFERMKPELLRQYPGRVVVIYNGQVIEVGNEDESVADVALRLYERMGYAPIYVQRVEESPRVYKISGPRMVH